MTLTRGTLHASLARRTTAPTAWNVQPLQQHHGEDDGADATDDTQNDDTADDDTAAQQDDTKADADTDWKKKYEETLSHSRKHEARAKENAAAAKRLADLKKAQMSEVEKVQAEREADRKEAEQAKADLARERAARKYSLTDDDLALLAGVPVDEFDARAKKLSERIAKSTTSSSSGGEVGGGRGPAKPASLSAAIGAHYNK